MKVILEIQEEQGRNKGKICIAHMYNRNVIFEILM